MSLQVSILVFHCLGFKFGFRHLSPIPLTATEEFIVIGVDLVRRFTFRDSKQVNYSSITNGYRRQVSRDVELITGVKCQLLWSKISLPIDGTTVCRRFFVSA